MKRFTNPAAANAAAIDLRAQGDLPAAIATLRDAADAFPATVALRQNLAQMLYESGDANAAIAEHRIVLRSNDRNVASHLALYELLQIAGDRVMALAHQRLALEEQRVYSSIAPEERRVVLFVMAPGDWQANIPVDFLIDARTTTVHKLYLIDESYLRRDVIPRYDVIWNAIAESADNHRYLELAERLMGERDRPALNAPQRVLATARLRLADTLRATGARVAAISEMRAADLQSGALPYPFPVIARPAGSHAGHGLARLDSAADCAPYVQEHEAHAYYVSPFVDYASADGYFRKYRIVFVDGVPYPVHLAISKNWMIHYYNAEMADNAWMREEEARFLADLRSAFGKTQFQTLLEIANAAGLEYFGIDATLDANGDVLVFEADPAMLVHTTDPVELYPYKHEFIPRIYRAIEVMIDRRKTADT